MKLTQEQIQILSDSKIEDNRFYLPWQLERKAYININEILNSIGLIWNRWKKAHIVEGFTQEDLENAISDVIETWEVETLKETIKKFQFYPTPVEVVEYLVTLADIKETDRVLEPSAWQWAIYKKINPLCYAVWVELNIENYNILKQIYWWDRWEILNMDFLDYQDKADKIVANPPFSKSQDVKHILHMYELLNEWGTLVSIAGSWVTFREWKLYDELRALNPEIIELPEWSFKESWTLVNTVIVRIKK